MKDYEMTENRGSSKTAPSKLLRTNRLKDETLVKPLTLIIIGKDGKCIFNRDFTDVEGDKEVDPDLISAFLAAFSSQAARAFDVRMHAPPITRLSGGSTSYVFEWGNRVFAATTVQPPPEGDFGLSVEALRSKLREIISYVEEKFSSYIEGTFTDMKSMESLETLTEEIFREQLLSKEESSLSPQILLENPNNFFFGWVDREKGSKMYQRLSAREAFLKKNEMTETTAKTIVDMLRSPKSLQELIDLVGDKVKPKNLPNFLLFLQTRNIIYAYKIKPVKHIE